MKRGRDFLELKEQLDDITEIQATIETIRQDATYEWILVGKKLKVDRHITQNIAQLVIGKDPDWVDLEIDLEEEVEEMLVDFNTAFESLDTPSRLQFAAFMRGVN